MFEKLPTYIKPTVFYSIIAGIILGILTLIPVINFFVIFLFWCIGGIIVFLLKKTNFLGILTNREGIAIGTISGMISVCVAAIVYFPLSLIIGAIFKTASVGFLFTTSFTASAFSVFVLGMIVFFVGLMNIVFSIGSSLLAIYIINTYFEEPQEIERFEIEK